MKKRNNLSSNLPSRTVGTTSLKIKENKGLTCDRVLKAYR